MAGRFLIKQIAYLNSLRKCGYLAYSSGYFLFCGFDHLNVLYNPFDEIDLSALQ